MVHFVLSAFLWLAPVEGELMPTFAARVLAVRRVSACLCQGSNDACRIRYADFSIAANLVYNIVLILLLYCRSVKYTCTETFRFPSYRML